MNPRDAISRALGSLDAIIGIRPHLGYSIEGVIVAAKEAREILERARAELDRQGQLLAEAERLRMEHCPEDQPVICTECNGEIRGSPHWISGLPYHPTCIYYTRVSGAPDTGDGQVYSGTC